MALRRVSYSRSRLRAAGAVVSLGLLATACGGHDMANMETGPPGSMSMPETGGHGSMPGMDEMASGNGLASEVSGFSFALRQDATSLPAGQSIDFEFQIQSARGEAVTAFELDQTKLMHFYLIRSDLTGFQHVHPELADDGTWTAPLAAAEPGSYRAYASFIAKDSSGKAVPLVLSQPVAVAGAATETPLPAASTSTEVDGYTLTVTGKATAGMEQPITVAFNKDGQSVTDLEPYLDTYAHLTAFHEGDLAFAHLHPEGAVTDKYGGPTLSFGTDLPGPGNYRLFLQFQTAGTLHTAALTLSVG